MELPDERDILEAYLGKAASELNSLASRIENCGRCKLNKSGGRSISGAGHPLADLFLLKAQVSEQERQEDVAFAGPITDVLRKAFKKLGGDISLIYGTNVLKCYAEKKRARESEMRACLPYLRAEIEICQPRVVLAMGPVPCYALGASAVSLERIEYKPGSIIKMRPDLHAVITCDVENGLDDESSKRRFWEDLQFAQALINREIAKERDS